MPILAVANSSASDAKQGALEPIPVQEAAIGKWRDARFGMFIHWGPVSLTDQEISWSRGSKNLPVEKYDALYQQFDPEKFNADAWVAVAKAAGMKYIVLTCKHHDGFCLWDTKQTDYNIMHTPFKRDVVKELSTACKKGGMAFGCYYSTCDWHNPDFPLTSPGGRTVREHADLEKYTDYLKAQVTELLQNYGPLFTLWFDVPEGFDRNRGQSVINMARTIQPDIVIDDRTGASGDYSTPEQKIGGFDMTRPWESCMTVSAHNHWAWGGDRDGVKPLSQILLMLINCAGGDGNMLLNVGPRPTGEIDAEQAARLKDVGGWLAINGESIYGTRGGPFIPTSNYASTRKESTIYLHILKWNGDTAVLPPLPGEIVSSSLLVGKGTATVTSAPNKLTIKVAPNDQQPVDTIIKLVMKGSALDIAPIKPSNV